MSALLTGNLPLIADAPDGIRKLRGLILELAVRGKLVPQDPNDEPASELLKRIAQERARLEAAGTCKKSKATPLVGENEKPFNLPNGWEWVRLGTVSKNVQYGYTASANHASKDVLLLRITDIQGNRVDWDSVPGCQISATDIPAYQLQRGDIVIARTGGTIGKSYLVDGLDRPAIFASYLIRVGYLHGTNPTYTKVFLGSECYWSQLYANSMGTGQPNVNGTALSSLVFPLPPIAEQHRIVAKVDELMALCDQLEAEQADAEAAHARLVDALLAALTRSTDADDFAANWHRLAAHFDTLFTTEAAIDALKQTVLQLAVMGKLVPQDPDDEPASEFLTLISQERVQLEAKGTAKKWKPRLPVEGDEQPFELPNGWEWARLGDLGLLGSSSRVHQKDWTDRGVPFYRAREIVKLSQNGFVRNELYISEALFESLSASGLVPAENDLMVTGVGTIGVPYIVNKADKFYFKDASVLIFKNYHRLCAKYIFTFMTSPFWVNKIHEKSMGTTVDTLTIARANEVPFPLPPLAEQHRIVAKVDELMALCDRLKADLAAARQRQATLADTLIAAALEAA
ncbi:restriction endonuclease subunit S [Methyloversatilis discipulorum]|uniref:restriction endonuclease subunit S n=1 Tax=Methyloversatilis discipulorum TaxID=1119528 RepID=UPI003F2A614A